MDISPKTFSIKKAFWLANIVGWCLMGLFVNITAAFWDASFELRYYFAPVNAFVGFTSSVLFREYLLRIWHMPIWPFLWRSQIAMVIAVVLWSYLGFEVHWLVTPEPRGNFLNFLGAIKYNIFIFLCWFSLYFGVKYYLESQASLQRALEAESLANQAQLSMLRYQLNPHFLFNTLNGISTLILEGEKKQANTMLSQLSRFLRHTLDGPVDDDTTLNKEFESLKLYLDIESTRFEDRLNINVELDDKVKQAKVPPLFLQPLIENAIKYAVEPRESGAKISISAKLLDDSEQKKVNIVVQDNGPGIELDSHGWPSKQGVGLSNFIQRLYTRFPNTIDLQFRNEIEGGLCVSISFPLIEANS